MVAFSGRTETKINLAECEANYMKHVGQKEDLVDFNDLFKGRCFLKYKNTEMEELEAKIKILYNKVNPGNKDNIISQSENEEN